MSDLKLFLPIAKIDLDQRLVYGVATAETPDRSGEICDYLSTKPYYEAWSAEATQASGGKSLGAVRAMHGGVAAGKLTDISFDDEGRRILVAAKIVDDDEWRKVEEGVYTGFSQGGRYVERWPDPDSGLTRYTAEPREISLVDLPCLPSATFEVVKDGIARRRAFASRPAGQSGLAESGADGAPAAVESLAAPQRNRARELARRTPAPDADAATLALTQILEESGAPPAPAPTHEEPGANSRVGQTHEERGAPPGVVQTHEETGAPPGVAPAVAAPRSVLADEPVPSPELVKALRQTAALRSQMQALAPALAALDARLASLEAQPSPAKAAIRAMAKSAEGAQAPPLTVEDAVRRLAALPPEERAYALMKISLANPLAQRA